MRTITSFCIGTALWLAIAVSTSASADFNPDGDEAIVVKQNYERKTRSLEEDHMESLVQAHQKRIKQRIESMNVGPVVNTTHGPIRGVQDEEYSLYLGIRFAEPPTGSLRWKPPQEPPSWSDVKDASWFGDSCPQDSFQTILTGKSEDCLFLNVYTPANLTTDSNLPVILFFYGGSWKDGSASFPLYWANQDIEDREDVIYVTANYRLNVFGFLASDALRSESSDGSVGNYGFKDQRLAMQWVRNNIKSFGGNPNLLTIQGESAGAGSVSGHLVSPASKGLFDRAIMESGPIAIWIAQPFKVSVVKYNALVKNAECSKTQFLRIGEDATLACLRNMTTDQLMSAAHGLPSGLVQWSPVIDGVEFPDFPEKLAAAGKIHNVPVLLGSNRDEGTLFTHAPHDLNASNYKGYLEQRFGKDLGDTVYKQYPLANYESPWWAVSHVIGDAAMTCPARRTSQWLTGRQNADNVYEYFFQHELEVIKWFVPYKGVCHASELIFVFDLKLGLWTDDEKELALKFVRYWTRFAKYGDPNGGDDLQWPVYSNSSDTLLVLDTPKLSHESNLKEELCDFWDTQTVPWSIIWGYDDE